MQSRTHNFEFDVNFSFDRDNLFLATTNFPGSIIPPSGSFIITETGDFIITETGDRMITE